MKDIFVPLEIAKKLREIGFKTLCIAYYNTDNNKLYHLDTDYVVVQGNRKEIVLAPTWEQVFLWFRDRDAFSYIKKFANKDKFHYVIGDREYFDLFETYEECREALVLYLIKIYKKNGIKSKF